MKRMRTGRAMPAVEFRMDARRPWAEFVDIPQKRVSLPFVRRFPAEFQAESASAVGRTGLRLLRLAQSFSWKW